MGNYQESERIVVKIGTDTLARDGVFDTGYGDNIARQVAAVNAQIVLVTSGAMTLGEQNDPATGQALLRDRWAKSFADVGLGIEEILVEEGKTAEAAQKVRSALNRGNVPVVNGNDAVHQRMSGGTELPMANNDILSSTVAADLHTHLLLLTNVDGVLDRHGVVIQRVSHPSEVVIFEGISQNGKGGMKTKVQAAWEIAQTGRKSVIANGRRPGVIMDFVQGRNGFGTRFVPQPMVYSKR